LYTFRHLKLTTQNWPGDGKLVTTDTNSPGDTEPVEVNITYPIFSVQNYFRKLKKTSNKQNKKFRREIEWYT
jgi:hypothetical protein